MRICPKFDYPLILRCTCFVLGQNHPSIKALAQYILAKSAGNPAAHAALQTLLGPQGLQSQNHVGFVFSERLVNMPVQVVPHMYRMLADEIQWANDDVSLSLIHVLPCAPFLP